MRGNMPEGFFRNFPNVPQFGMMLGGGRLGVAFVTLDEQTAQENDVTTTEGALIQEVVENSPAAEAGLQVGDIITAVNGEAVDVEHTLRDRLAAYEAGDEITLAVLRDGASQDIPVTLGEPTDMMPGDFFHFFDGPNGFRFPGMPDGEVPQEAPAAPNL
jgi:membrane-associated protease RseP (regulator of RpoE activity)